MADIEIKTTVSVPEKYAELITLMSKDREALPLQLWADEVVKMLRTEAANCNMEVDEFIALSVAHQKGEANEP